jgi:hypothetical protein
MTTPPRTAARLGLGVLAAALGLSVGCKSREGAASGGSGRSDPLVAGPGRIPRQNIPLPERGTGTAGNSKGRGDPLLGSPVARPGDRSGYTNDPERWKGGPYVPGPGGTPAALAARTADDGFGLKIETPGGTPLTPAGGTAPLATDLPADVAPLAAELKGFGVNHGDSTVSREGDQFLFQARVPIGNGAVRGYSGAGPTEAAAMRQVLEQVRHDRGR